MRWFKKSNPNSQLPEPEVTYTSVERRVHRVEELHGWISGKSQSVLLRILLELILERNVIPELNKQLEQIDRILALSLFTTYQLWRSSLKEDEKFRETDLSTAARVVVMSLNLPAVNQGREDSILEQLKRDSKYRLYLIQLCDPIAHQKLGAGRPGYTLSDVEKFRKLAKVLIKTKITRPYVWKDDIE